VCYTLQVGRQAMEERIGFMTCSLEQLAQQLHAYLEGQEDAHVVRPSFATIPPLAPFTNESLMAQTRPTDLLKAWVNGTDVEWHKLYRASRPQRTGLPGYPFARERYWIEADRNSEAAFLHPTREPAPLHPLLHGNSSTAQQHRFTSRFSGKEPFLDDRYNHDEKVLPPAAYLEMARAAIEHSLPSRGDLVLLELYDTAWAEPFVATPSRELRVAVSGDGDDEIIFEMHGGSEADTLHCSGRARFVPRPSAHKLDISRLRQKVRQGVREFDDVAEAVGESIRFNGQRRRNLDMIAAIDAEFLVSLAVEPAIQANESCWLKPSVIQEVFRACGDALGSGVVWPPTGAQVRSLSSLRILSVCPSTTLAWVRYSPAGRVGAVDFLDIDLCDEDGNVSVQIRGLSVEASLEEAAAAEKMQQRNSVMLDSTRRAATQVVDPRLLHDKTLQKIKQLFGSVITLQPERIDARRALSDYGIDSLMITRLNEEFSKIFADLSKTAFFECKTLIEVTDYFLERHPGECLSLSGLQRPVVAAERNGPVNLPTAFDHGRQKGTRGRATGAFGPRRDDGRQPIAIIGLSGTYPQAATPGQFWENLKQGKDCITEIPAKRWPLEGFFDADPMRAVEQGRGYCKWGGFIDQFDQFDPLFFGISPLEALSIDPQERMFLQAVWHALESAGYKRLDLRQKFHGKVGVFAGITKLGFNLHGSEATRRERKFYPHTSFSSLANRVSYFLDITGPSMPIDTMCSSSLTAIHEACEHIHRGDCELAFAGGVNLYLHPSTYVDMAAQYALSRDGKCRSFGAGASGFVPGEGVGAVLLKPLAAAIADQDNIHALILATHVNHGGKTNGYTVPNPRAQADLIRGAIDKAGISARDISYIEAHGTGTQLGDPIEMEGLRQAFAQYTSDAGYCRVGSAKSNIGHLEAAAGMAGLTKVIFQMKHGQIAPSLHAEEINPAIRFDGSPFVLNRTLTSWDRRTGIDGRALPRTAGISSFGAGGANAHIIVQEFSPPSVTRLPRPASADQKVIVPLSAKTPQQLRQVAIELVELLAAETAKPSPTLPDRPRDRLDLHAVAYTLQVGREAMNERVGFIVESSGDLIRKLRAYIDGDQNGEDVYRSRAGGVSEDVSMINSDDDMQLAVSRWLARKKLSKLAEFWVDGLIFDWNELYGETKPTRVELPVYPFSAETFWVDIDKTYPITEAVPRAVRRQGLLEDILDRLDTAALETDEAVGMLRTMI
jgi:polyketide synthase PksN